MKIIKLGRWAYTPMGTFGTLYFGDDHVYSIERPWADNKPFESCIPESIYEMKLGYFYKGEYPAYKLLDVPDRTLIKIHKGNKMTDVNGCIALGETLGCLYNYWAVKNSRLAYDRFMDWMSNDKRAEIEIFNDTSKYRSGSL